MFILNVLLMEDFILTVFDSLNILRELIYVSNSSS